MASYMKFELADGTFVYVETTEGPKGASGLIPAGRGAEQAAEQAAASFDKSAGAVQKMAAALMQQFRAGFADQPEEVSISFGLKASGELGAFMVARGGMEANYNVSIRWRKEEKEEEKSEKTEEKKKEAK